LVNTIFPRKNVKILLEFYPLSLTAKKRLSGLDTGFVYFFEKIVVDTNFIVDVYLTIIKYY
jgi:hypothetical protein